MLAAPRLQVVETELSLTSYHLRLLAHPIASFSTKSPVPLLWYTRWGHFRMLESFHIWASIRNLDFRKKSRGPQLYGRFGLWMLGIGRFRV